MQTRFRQFWLGAVMVGVGLGFGQTATAEDEPADLILHNGKVVTVDEDFTIAEAVAVRDGQIQAVGDEDSVLENADSDTKLIDLGGKMVLPGLMDSHTHATAAAMTEYDHRIPQMRTIDDVLEYVEQRASQQADGEWIVLQQIFITRLEEKRYPTRAELDEAAPNNPVIFRTGPDASLNSLALEHFDIDAETEAPDESRIERDEDGQPTGILRNWTHMIDLPETGSEPTWEDRYNRLNQLLTDYASVGLTSIAQRKVTERDRDLFKALHENDDLPVRVAGSRLVRPGDKSDQQLIDDIEQIAEEPLVDGGPMLRTIGVKVFLDGGMLTGSAYMREPWGTSEIYSIDDPDYRGLRSIEQDALETLVRATVENDLQFTAHCVGDGAVHALLDAYETVNEDMPIADTRPSITHSNFMSQQAIDMMTEMGVMADIQPAWLYLDGAVLLEQFGYERLEYFQPLYSLFQAGAVAGGGSDHMQKIGARRAVNPYDPWLGMWVTITRNARGLEPPLHPQEGLTREQAIRFYTINNAKILFLDDVAGSLEPGKLADMVVIDRDILTCPVDQIRNTSVLRTYVAGELIHQAE